jgi:hypothetical protein
MIRVAIVLFLLLGAGRALADDIRPAYLDIEEFETGALHVLWKVPILPVQPERLTPSFPDGYQVTTPTQRVKTSSAVIERWSMVSGGEGLAGMIIGIDGLEETAMDTLVRIQLADGSIHRDVLRPTARSMTVPAGAPGEPVSAGPWKYVVLFCAAWPLSLLPRARKRGLLPCAIALVAGCLGGHALGWLDLGSRLPSDAEAKRILRGLMLNTYRAFMLEHDEEVYDVLARSVEGAFLGEVFLQNREAMRIDDPEAAQSLVDRLDVTTIESMERSEGGGVAIVARWDVYGSVMHWDHIHFRCNTYKAELTIVPSGNYWKLTRLKLLDEERVI